MALLLLLFLAAMRSGSSGDLVVGEVMAEFDQTSCSKNKFINWLFLCSRDKVQFLKSYILGSIEVW